MRVINNNTLELPIEYYGIEKSECPYYIEVERNINLKEKEIDEILRVYVDVNLEFNIKGKRIEDEFESLNCYMFNINLNIEYLGRQNPGELNIFQINISEYSYILDDIDESQINPKINDVYVSKEGESSIYIYSIIKLY